MEDPTAKNFSPQALTAFAAGLAGLPADEIAKAKRLYIANALDDFDAFETTLEAFGCMQLTFGLIPFFWPIIYAQRKTLNAHRKASRDKIVNAIEIWRDDLGPDYGRFLSRINGAEVA